jgi:EAL domain-containing protein (putative c-di-GMP-specific phosphodiesterase class I)
VHLDDFGTGYSSLSWLTQFPVDAVKIDKTFTADLGIDERKTAVIRAFIQVAQELRFVVVAEGIETEDQRRWLREMGCDRGQGYLFARPVRPEQASWI